MKKRIYTLNENYFSNITHSSAYIAGFIMADGCIQKRLNKNKLPFKLSISINPKDIEVLEFIKKELNYSGPITNVQQFDNRTNKIYYRNTLSISSEKICNDLKSIWNIFPAKTGREKLPELDKNILYSFLLGLFDGDGHVSIRNRLLHINLASASSDFLSSIRNFTNLGKVHINSSCSSWRIANVEGYILRDLMYKNTSFSLSRKRKIFYQQELDIKLRGKKFTYIDDQIITDYFQSNPSPNFYVLAKLTGRKYSSSLVNRAVKLGLYNKKVYLRDLNDVEIDFIKQNYDRHKRGIIKQISKELNRPYHTIAAQIYRLKLNKDYSN